ncbi:cytochrome c maturation protein CcmE [Gallaecimonas kandeliae]|uniref:cytochrome c maturation protein CcmE n=1 Tax=Gallaecimonas kandeliae TaxID=3029055 RepID=UPI00264721C1|nr:cytochrome c maturation protein CcmE [Gallaecimonas kandeliae]WKE66772.1 cytochrome c maturation protein CcmE [Gallaecimonas kandeliae]
MNPRRKARLAIVLAIGLGLSATVGLVLYALGQNIDLFYTPVEMHHGKDGVLPQAGQRLRIGGLVVPGTVTRDAKSLAVSFDLTDNSGERVRVSYVGILPDLFREGQGIVAQGRLQADGTVQASEVLAKHDEKYMPPEVAGAAKAQHERGVNGS